MIVLKVWMITFAIKKMIRINDDSKYTDFNNKKLLASCLEQTVYCSHVRLFNAIFVVMCKKWSESWKDRWGSV